MLNLNLSNIGNRSDVDASDSDVDVNDVDVMSVMLVSVIVLFGTGKKYLTHAVNSGLNIQAVFGTCRVIMQRGRDGG